ncbi:MAG: hypothetical protein JNL11_20235 [Bdellovibrionaceae bacterium]|nr:hypothetical protein [Pseudobdellovibrionaceae bacterium]
MTQKKKPFQIIETVTRVAFTRPTTILVISALVLIFSIFGARSLKVELDLYNSHNTDFPSLTRLWDMMEEFEDFSTISLLIEWPKEPSSEQVCSLISKVNDIETTAEGTKSTFHIFKLRGIESHPTEYWYPLTLPDPCATAGVGLADLKKSLDTKHPFCRLSPNNSQLLVQVRLEPDFSLETVKHWLYDIKSPEYKTSGIGPAVFQYYVNEILKKDSFQHIVLVIFFLVFFKIFFGTWRTGFYYMLTVIATLISLAGIMGTLGIPVDILSNSLFLITAIAGTADYIFICWGMSRGKTLKESVMGYCRPGFFTSFTTAIGFISLCVSDLTTIQRFGFAAALGAMLEWYFTFMVFPAFLEKCKFQTEFVTKKTDHRLIQNVKRVNHWTPPKALTIGFCFFVFAGPFLFFKLRFEENPAKNFPSQHPIKQSLNHFNQALGWQNSVFIEFPNTLTRASIEQCLGEIEKSKLVASIDNPFKIEDYLLKNLSPIRRDSVQFELTKYGPLKLFNSGDYTRAIVYLKSNSPNDISELHKISQIYCPTGAAIVGQSDVYREASEVLSHTLSESFLISLAIVMFIIYYLQKSLGNKLYVLVPMSLLAGPLFLISAMVLLDLPISPFNSMFLAILVGITGDNAIQYLFTKEDGNIDSGVEENGPASIIIGLITVISSLLFLFQTLIPMKILGLLFSAGFLLSLFGDLWILKGLLQLKSYLTKISTTPNAGLAPKE